METTSHWQQVYSQKSPDDQTWYQPRPAYLANLVRHLAPGGHLIMAAFAPGGPEKCSGLPVQQYSAASLADTLGDDWRLLDSRDELHPTPWGGEQAFSYALFNMRLA